VGQEEESKGRNGMNTPITFEGMMLVGFIFWVMYLFNQHSENRREEIRRYNEKYPFGQYKSRYETRSQRGED
jgi:hypothetical protein